MGSQTKMSTHAPLAEPLHPHTHAHRKLTLAFESPAGLSSGYWKSSDAWWELQNTSVQLHIQQDSHILPLQINAFTERLMARERAGRVGLGILWAYKHTKCVTSSRSDPFSLHSPRHEQNHGGLPKTITEKSESAWCETLRFWAACKCPWTPTQPRYPEPRDWWKVTHRWQLDWWSVCVLLQWLKQLIGKMGKCTTTMRSYQILFSRHSPGFFLLHSVLRRTSPIYTVQHQHWA